MEKTSSKLGTLGVVAIVAPLFAILGAATWFAAQAWISVSGPPMPPAGYVAMTLGIVFSVVIGCGQIPPRLAIGAPRPMFRPW